MKVLEIKTCHLNFNFIEVGNSHLLFILGYVVLDKNLQPKGYYNFDEKTIWAGCKECRNFLDNIASNKRNRDFLSSYKASGTLGIMPWGLILLHSQVTKNYAKFFKLKENSIHSALGFRN